MENIRLRENISSKYKWDLGKIYTNEKEIKNDIKLVREKAKSFLSYRDNLTSSSDNLYEAIKEYFSIIRIIDKLTVYSNMKFHEDMGMSKSQELVGKIDKLSDEVNEDLAFFTPTLLKEDYSKIENFIKENSKLKEYEFTLKDTFREKAHILSANIEKILARLGEIFSSSENTYEMLDTVDMSFENIKINRKNLPLNQSNYTVYLKDNNRDIRCTAFNNYYDSYNNYKNTYASTLAGAVKIDSFISNTRGYKDSLNMSLFSDNISESLYNKLIDTVNKNININHKYMKLKKDVLNLDELHMYDISVPLISSLNKKYSYEEAITLVLDALSVLGKDYNKKLNNLFKSNIIDVFNNKNKKTGAYSWGSYDTMPYVLLNFEGTFNDVSTMTHELGHAMHSLYSNTNNTYEDASYTIFLAEIASTVNEILLNKYCTANSKTKEEKLFYINSLLENIRTTLIRQTMFAEFEKIIHDKYNCGEVLTEELITNIYYELNKKYHGESVVCDLKIGLEWARISHFYSSFYVYKYATGIACSLKIASDILNNKEHALDNYIDLLSSGSTDYPENLLQKVGIDIANDNTIEEAFYLYDNLIDEFKNTYNM